MSFEVIGFNKHPLFRWTAMVGALDEFGEISFKVGVIHDPLSFGKRVVCAKVQGFGAVFRPEEIDRLTKNMNKAQVEWPSYAKRFAETLQGAADDARYASDAANKVMI